MNCLISFINANLGIIKKLFGKKAQNIPPAWQAYANAIGIETTQLTDEQKRQAFIEHVLRNTDCFEEIQFRGITCQHLENE